MVSTLRTLAIATALTGAAALASTAALVPAHAQDAAAPTLSADAGVLTMINVMQPNEGTTQDELAELITTGLKETSVLPGFINATVHKSKDNDYVVVYAQWKDQASVDNAVRVISSGEGSPTHAAAFGASAPEFHPYDVIAVVPAASE